MQQSVENGLGEDLIPNELLVPLLSGVFVGGGVWAVMEFRVKQLRKEVNGIGRKTEVLVRYSLESEPEEAKRKRLNDLLKG